MLGVYALNAVQTLRAVMWWMDVTPPPTANDSVVIELAFEK